MAQSVYLSLGSNLGDREGTLRAALQALAGAIQIETVSSLYETEPVGVRDQPAFLNLAVKGTTGLDADALLEATQAVERRLGRMPTYHWGPRLLDVDILLLGDRIVERENLSIPHPEMVNRAFVLVPLAEIEPDLIHPVLKRSIALLRREVPGLETVHLLRSDWMP